MFCCNDMVEAGSPEGEVLVRATKLAPDTPAVEPVPMIGVEVETTPKGAVETRPCCGTGKQKANFVSIFRIFHTHHGGSRANLRG